METLSSGEFYIFRTKNEVLLIVGICHDCIWNERI